MKNLYLFLFLLTAQITFGQEVFQWSSPIDVADNSYGHLYPRIVISNDKPVVSWGHDNKIFIAKDDGQGFSDPVQINNPTTLAYTASWTGPDIAVKDDLVYVTFMHQDWGEKSYIVRSMDGGNSFTDPMLIENYQDSTSRFPTVAVDQNGNPIVSIMKMTKVGTHPHYVVRKSNNYGDSFIQEHDMAQWSGAESEACDCCPAAIKILENKVALFFRNNINNIRDIWVGISEDNANSFTDGFEIDDSQWFIQGCPSSGPDGIIHKDNLYSVFLSDGLSYISKTNASSGVIEEINQLGGDATLGSQNFPRIDKFEDRAAVVWKQQYGGIYLMYSYFQNLNDGMIAMTDTLYSNSFTSADVALSADAVHVVWQNTASGTIKYVKGSLVSSIKDHPVLSKPTIYPNPSTDRLNIKSNPDFKTISIYNFDGTIAVKQQRFSSSIDVTSIPPGQYIIVINAEDKGIIRTTFTKS